MTSGSEVKFDLPARPEPRARAPWGMLLAGLVLGGAIGYLVHPAVCPGTSCPASGTAEGSAGLLSAAELRGLAETLEKNQLYGQAAETWERAANLTPAEGAERAEMLFRIGKNFSLAGRHEEALTYLFAAENADKTGQWSSSIHRMVLDGLSALGLEDAREYQAKRRASLGGAENAQSQPSSKDEHDGRVLNEGASGRGGEGEMERRRDGEMERQREGGTAGRRDGEDGS